jgi:TRAP-type C4-dicarboxylate transport system substrate-binding protein
MTILRNRARRSGVVAAAFAAALVLGGCAGGSGDGVQPSEGGGDDLADLEPMTLIYASPLPETNTQGSSEVAFIEYIEDKTEGKITFERYFAGALFPATEAISGVQNGLADIATGGPIYSPNELPVGSWAMSLGLEPAADNSAFGQLQAYLSVFDLLQQKPEIEAEYAEQGLHPLIPYTGTQYGLSCKEPIATLDEAAGKVTSSLPIWAPEVESLGMTVTYIPATEAYEALQRGVVDCVVGSLAGHASISLYEVAPYWLPLDLRNTVGQVRPMMSLEVWDSLPASVQTIFEEAEVHALQSFIEADLSGGAAVLTGDEKTYEIVDVSALNEKLAEIKPGLLEALPDTAPDTLADPKGIIDAYGSTLSEWQSTLEDLGASPTDDWAAGVEGGPELPIAAAFDKLREKYSLTD